MGETTERVRTDIVVNDGDANRAFGRMVAGTDRLRGAFGGVVGRAAALGTGILGAVGIARTVAGLDRGYQAVARIKSITGVAAKEAHSLADTFENAGVEAASAERIIMSMARKSALLGAGTKEADALGVAYKKLGIDISAGPSAKLLQMSKAAVSGKLGVVGLTTMMGTSKREAADFLTMLKKGPVELKEMMDSQLNSADLIDDKALASWQKMQQAKRNLSDAWGSVAGAFYKTIVPVATKFLTYFGDRLEKWAPAAERFGTYLVDHMDEALRIAKVLAVTIGGIKMLGGIDGVTGIAKGIGSIARGSMAARGAGGAVAAVNAAGSGATAITSARALLNPTGIAAVMSRAQRDSHFAGMALKVAQKSSPYASAMGAGDFAPKLGRGAGLIGSVMGGAGTAGSSIFKIIGSLAKLGGVAVLIGGVVVGIMAIVKNSDGIRERLGSLLKEIGKSLVSVGKALAPLWELGKRLAVVVGKTLVFAVEKLLQVVNLLMPVLQAIGDTIGWVAKQALALGGFKVGGASVASILTLSHAGVTSGVSKEEFPWVKKAREDRVRNSKVAKRLGDESVRQEMAKRAAAVGYGQNAQAIMRNVMDQAKTKTEINLMPGANVTVYQDFAPGMDADKVKLSMLSDISKAGERRLGSGLAPLFTSRGG